MEERSPEGRDCYWVSVAVDALLVRSPWARVALLDGDLVRVIVPDSALERTPYRAWGPVHDVVKGSQMDHKPPPRERTHPSD